MPNSPRLILKTSDSTEQASLAEYFFEIRGQDALQKILNDTVEADKKALAAVQAATTLALTIRSPSLRRNNPGERAIHGNQSQNRARSVRACDCYAHRKTGFDVLNPGRAPDQRTSSNSDRYTFPTARTAPGYRCRGTKHGRCERADRGCLCRVLSFADALSRRRSGEFGNQKPPGSPSRFWSVGPSISETVYDGGLRRATVNQYIAIYNANVAAYRQSVLTAFQQVEDSLAQSHSVAADSPSAGSGRLIPELTAARAGALR